MIKITSALISMSLIAACTDSATTDEPAGGGKNDDTTGAFFCESFMKNWIRSSEIRDRDEHESKEAEVTDTRVVYGYSGDAAVTTRITVLLGRINEHSDDWIAIAEEGEDITGTKPECRLRALEWVDGSGSTFGTLTEAMQAAMLPERSCLDKLDPYVLERAGAGAKIVGYDPIYGSDRDGKVENTISSAFVVHVQGDKEPSDYVMVVENGTCFPQQLEHVASGTIPAIPKP
jgi:hypothetical protein